MKNFLGRIHWFLIEGTVVSLGVVAIVWVSHWPVLFLGLAIFGALIYLVIDMNCFEWVCKNGHVHYQGVRFFYDKYCHECAAEMELKKRRCKSFPI